MAGYDFYLRFRDFQAFGHEFNAHLVGGVIYRRGGELYFECVAVKAADHVFGRSRLHEDCEGDAFRMFGNWEHLIYIHRRGAKSAESLYFFGFR